MCPQQSHNVKFANHTCCCLANAIGPHSEPAKCKCNPDLLRAYLETFIPSIYTGSSSCILLFVSQNQKKRITPVD